MIAFFLRCLFRCCPYGLLVCVSLSATAAPAPEVIPLWKNGPPGFEDRRTEPEEAKDYWVKNVHNPSLTMYRPSKDEANGTAVIIAPGGGHGLLVINSEGRDAAAYFTGLGVTAFVLKYRLAREEGSPYQLPTHPQADGKRAVRLVRARAKEWGVDPERVGMLGFSAGGETVNWTAFGKDETKTGVRDSLSAYSAVPDFLMLVYPGPLGIPQSVDASAPPMFMVVANDDECCSEPVMQLLQIYRRAGASVEAHIYARGGHAFNMGRRTELRTLRDWPQRLNDWLMDNQWLQKKSVVPK